jgi:hypothetical protein
MFRGPRPPAGVALTLLVCGAGLLASCRELEGFSTGTGEIYRGAIVPADDVRRGIDLDADGTDDVLGPETTLEMTLRVEEFQTRDVARLTTSDGLLRDAPLLPIEAQWRDTLSGLTFPAGRLRSGLYFAVAADDAPGDLARSELLVVLSLMVDSTVEVRLVSGPDRLYGFFRLRKTTRSP